MKPVLYKAPHWVRQIVPMILVLALVGCDEGPSKARKTNVSQQELSQRDKFIQPDPAKQLAPLFQKQAKELEGQKDLIVSQTQTIKELTLVLKNLNARMNRMERKVDLTLAQVTQRIMGTGGGVMAKNTTNGGKEKPLAKKVPAPKTSLPSETGKEKPVTLGPDKGGKKVVKKLEMPLLAKVDPPKGLLKDPTGQPQEPGPKVSKMPAIVEKKPLKTPKKILVNLDKGHQVITFDLLASYHYQMPPVGQKPKDQIPGVIKKLDKKKVVVQGYMIPIKIEAGAIVSFVLVRNQMACCYGVVPKINEWVFVEMEKDKRARFVPDTPIKIYGTIEVGEQMKKGRLINVYRMTASSVDEVM